MNYFLTLLIIFLTITDVSAQNEKLKLKVVYPKADTIQVNKKDAVFFENFSTLNEYKLNLINTYIEDGYIYLKDSLYTLSPNEYRLELELNHQIKLINIIIPEEIIPYLNNYKSRLDRRILQLNFHEFKTFQNTVSNALDNNGKSFDSFQLTELSEIDKQTIQTKLLFKEKKTRYIDKIYVKGYEDFPSSFIKYRLDLHTKKRFSPEKVIEKSKNINNLIFATNIKNPEIQFTADSTKLYLYIDKNNANLFDGFIGFNSTEETSLELNGYIDLNLINNLNFGEELRINYKNDGRAQQQFNANLKLPYLFKTPITAEAGLTIFRKDSAFSNTSQKVGLNYQIHPLVTVGSNAEFTNSAILENGANSFLDLSENFKASFYGINANYLKIQPIVGKFNAIRQIQINLLTGSRSATTTSSEQFKTSLTSQYTFQIQPSLYLHTSTNAAWLSSSNYIDNELFRFGGINTIRGFEENALVASLFGTLATELRYFLSPNLYANSVLDVGYYENSLQNFSENLYSFGFGLGIETKAGVLRLIFANGTSNTQKFSFENTQVHLSLFSVL